MIDSEEKLAAALRRLGDETRSREAPPHVEQRLLVRFGERGRRQARTAWWLSVAAALALIASLGIALLHPRPASTPALTAGPQAEDFEGFVAVPYRAPARLERATVVRVKMPREALVTLGMPVAAGSPEVVQADLLLAEDGMAHAVRLVR